MCCFGLYEKIVDSIIHFFKDIKNNLRFLTPIAIGVFLGVFLFGNILKFLFNKFYIPTCFVFIGLILGSLKLVIKQANFKKITLSHLIAFLVTLSLSIYLIVLEKTLNFSMNISSNTYLIIAGVLMSAGIVIPGISKTVILMILGIYPMYLSAVSNLNLNFLLPIGFGLLIGGIIFLSLINFLFKFAKSYTYFGIIGFIVASVFVIYPGFTFDIQGFISILLLIISFVGGLKLADLEKNR
ncbi:MAG: DUF368 domain-containing protein [Clostridia bacterium]|nr:DUF368 domain-containing protein [Clostridia bacterium]